MSCKLLLSLCFVLKLPHSAVFKLSTFTKLMYRDNLISGIILKRFFFFIILSFFFKSYFTIKSFCLYEIISSRYNKKTTEYYHCFSSSDHTFWLFSIVSIYSAYKKKTTVAYVVCNVLFSDNYMCYKNCLLKQFQHFLIHKAFIVFCICTQIII